MNSRFIPRCAGLAAALCAATVVLAPCAARAQASAGVAFSPLYSFGSSSNDGSLPEGGLIVGADGNFYGMTTSGGTGNSGTVYTLTPSGSESILHDFANSPDGCDPYGQLLLGSDGNFYGTANEGGDQTVGEDFVMTPSGAVTQLFSFNWEDAGWQGTYPRSGFVRGPDGDYYGTLTYTSDGQPNGYTYKITSKGSLTVLHTFTGHPDEGSYPYAPLVLGTDGNFYGTTGRGGGDDLGTVFKMTPSGAVTTLHSFAGGKDGAYPLAGLVEGADGSYYGLAYAGGANGTGSFFKITTAGKLTLLHSFAADPGNDNGGNSNGDRMDYGSGSGNADGAFPIEALILGSDGNFYGATECGGKSDTGEIFQVTPSGLLTPLYSFSADKNAGGNSDGCVPHGTLLEVGKGTFYGTTMYGGASNKGEVYKFSVAGVAAGLSFSPASVTGRQPSTGTVTLSLPAPAGGASISLSSNSTSVTVPSSVTVVAGATSATFTATTFNVTSAVTATIKATYNNASKTANLTVSPLALASLALSPTSVVGGQANSTGTIMLSGSAASATVVTLTSDNTAAATVPASVTIAARASSATFTVTSKAVTANASAAITATLGSVSKTAALAVTVPVVPLKSITLTPTSTVGGATTTANRVYLTGNAAANTVVTLTSSNPAVASVPASVTVAEGYSSHLFSIAAQSVSTAQTVTITATSGGVSQSAVLTVTPPAPVAETRFDFNKDGHADLVWYNTVSGSLSVWDMNDTSILSIGSTFASLAPASGWVPVATPDVNADGYPDLMWWNSQSGAMSIWTLQNTNVTAFYNTFADVPDTTWKPVAAADVTGTTWELVFQNTASGDIAVWQMNGQTVTAYSGTIGSLGAGSPWQVVGAPDLDGDGHSDLLFWNSQTGEVSWWACNLATPQVLAYNGDFTQVANTSWHLVGSEDTNGDGHPDLIWWNASTGEVSRWLLSGTTITQYGGDITQVTDTTWQPAAIR